MLRVDHPLGLCCDRFVMVGMKNVGVDGICTGTLYSTEFSVSFWAVFN